MRPMLKRRRRAVLSFLEEGLMPVGRRHAASLTSNRSLAGRGAQPGWAEIRRQLEYKGQ
jgi:transposase